MLTKNAIKWGFGGKMFPYTIVKRGTTIWLLMQLFCGLKVQAAADFGPAAVLPKGRFQAVVRVGNASDIENKYNSSGTLMSPSRMNVRLDNSFLRKNSAGMNKALDQINALDPARKLGDQADLGELNVKGSADVNYMAPQLAYGMTSRWTVGVGVPIINFKSDVHLEQSGVNTLPAILSNVGNVSQKENAELIAAAKKGPAAAANFLLQKQGIKAVDERDENFLGDVILGSVVKIYDSRYWSFFLLNNLELPTGPADDPDDLVDLNIFGRTNLSNTFYANLDVNYWLQFGFGVGYTWGIPDHIVKRVPKSENDFAPPLSSKEKLGRDPGDTITLNLATQMKATDVLEFGVGYELGYKTADKYDTGSQNLRYDLLEKDTYEEFHVAKFKISYTTVSSYLNGKSKIPMSVTYAVSDIFAGKNIERQLSNELLLKLYF
jgi:hypothetical protein